MSLVLASSTDSRYSSMASLNRLVLGHHVLTSHSCSLDQASEAGGWFDLCCLTRLMPRCPRHVFADRVLRLRMRKLLLFCDTKAVHAYRFALLLVQQSLLERCCS